MQEHYGGWYFICIYCGDTAEEELEGMQYWCPSCDSLRDYSEVVEWIDE